MADAPTPTPNASVEAAPTTVTTDSGVTRVQLGGDPNAAMAANQAATSTQDPAEATPAGDRPEGLPEGFDSWEAFGKAQLEAQTAPAEETTEAAPTGVQEAINQLPEATREKATPFFQEFAEKGDLSPESVKAAAEAFGFTEDMIQDYVAGAKARQAGAVDSMMQPFYEASGDKATFDAFSQWAQSGGMTAEQVTALEADMNGKEGVSKVKAAVDAWKAAGHGPAARDLSRTTAHQDHAAAPEGFRSQAEMERAMNDPRYRSDPAYRADVEQKVANSTY